MLTVGTWNIINSTVFLSMQASLAGCTRQSNISCPNKIYRHFIGEIKIKILDYYMYYYCANEYRKSNGEKQYVHEIAKPTPQAVVIVKIGNKLRKSTTN